MSLRSWQIISAVIGVLLLVAVVFLLIFGSKISDFNKLKEAEINLNLDKQQKKLELECQRFKEVVTTTYIADDIFGSFEFSYPKVWSTFVTKAVNSNQKGTMTFRGDPSMIILNGTDYNNAYTAIKIEVIAQKYVDYLSGAEYNLGKLLFTESDITVSGIKGKSFVGKPKNRDVTMKFIIVPIRDKTLYIGTDDVDRFSDNLNNVVDSFKIYK
ncbi:MAG: hypothetical protein WCP14_01195 [bacterium]